MLGEPLATFTTAEELEALAVLRAAGVDAVRTYQWWEAMTARLTLGTLTPHRCPWDVDVDGVRVEVKFSAEFVCDFATGPRPVFEFAAPHGERGTKTADVLALLGIDANDVAHAWVVPAALVRPARSITLTSPRARAGGSPRSSVTGWECPPTQLLPEVLRASRIGAL
jgi:hypothetical protein